MEISKREYALQEAKWIKDVPKDWISLRVKDVAELSPGFSNGGPNASEVCSVIPMESVTDRGSFENYESEELEFIAIGLTCFETGDVIIAKITPCMENGKGAFVQGLKTKYAFGSTEFHVLRPRNQVDGKFFYYYTYDVEFRKYAAENMTGAAGQKRVSTRFVQYTPIFLPSLNEQKYIAAYLDQQCAAIDRAIKTKKEQLTILDELRKSIIHRAVTKGLDDSVEFIDSGIEWIGKIPKGWKIKRLKRVCSRIQTGTTPPTSNTEYYIDGNIPWFSPGCYDGGIFLKEPAKLINEVAVQDNNLRLFPKDSIFIIGIGATIGKVALIKHEASCNQQIIGCVCGNNIFSKYLTYLMKIYENIIPNIAQNTTLPIMDQAKMGYLWIVEPLYEEQIAIGEFLDRKTLEIEKISSNLNEQIKILEDYRKSLIHECVTGKRRITEEEIKELRHV